MRVVPRADGTQALASVALRCYPKSRRVYAYLRWTSGSSKTAERYIGDVTDCPNRATALAEAWRRAKANSADVPTGARWIVKG